MFTARYNPPRFISIRRAGILIIVVVLSMFRSHSAIAADSLAACMLPANYFTGQTCLDQTYADCQAIWKTDITTHYIANKTCADVQHDAEIGRCSKSENDCFVGNHKQCDNKASDGYSFTKGGICPTTAVVKPSATPTGTLDTFTPEIPLPGVFEGEQKANDSLLARYIQAIFIYFIWVVGIIAGVMVMYGGIKWVSAAGNAGQIKDARDIVDNAVIGVIIALVSVVLLNIINPKLTSLEVPGLIDVAKEYFDGAAVTSVCAVGKSNEINATCGGIIRTGTGKGSKGSPLDTYCMGVICSTGGNFVGGGGHRHVCSLTKDLRTGYYNHATCLDQVPIQSPSGDYKDFSSLPVSSTSSLQTGKEAPVCGYAYGDAKLIGSSCPKPDDYNYYADKDICYLEGEKAIVIDESTPNDQMNSACATIQK